MRSIFLLLVLGTFAAGCKTAKKDDAAAPPSRRRATATVGPGPGERTAVRPTQGAVGRVIAVREPLRFVVIDFGAARMPRLEQHLSVYRLDQKVAELKVSGPYLGTTVAADITAGDAREGDLVREQ